MKDRATDRASSTAFELTMHRALLVNDIVHTILQNITSSPTDMINFASTCSALSSPALDMLWCKQSTLGPLIMCLPQDTWEVRNDGCIHLTREPLPTEWERVRLNASRIHKLMENPRSTRYKDSPKPHSHVLHKLFALFPPTLLFPNLHKLDFEVVSDRPEFSPDFALLRQFRLPRLEVLAFRLPSGIPVHEIEQLVDTIQAQASGLRQLVISASHVGAPFQIDLPFNKMPKLNLLAMLCNVCLTRHNIADTGLLRSLQVLSLTLHEGSGVLADLQLRDMPLELSALNNLTLIVDRLQLCTSFLLHVITPQLSRIDIMYCKYAAPQEVGKFVRSLHTTCQSFASLKNVSVHGDRGPPQGFYNPLSSDLFRPLLKFRRLTHVKFIATGQYCLDDAFINDAAVAWPDIQELWFASHETHTSAVTFTAVLSLASRCRSLHVLHLTFDGTQRPTLPYRKESEDVPDGKRELLPTQTALQRLHVGHSKLSRAALVPWILAAVFPNLVDLTWYQTPGVSDIIPWLPEAAEFQQLVIRRKTDPVEYAVRPNFVQSLLKVDISLESWEVSM
ncbi:hypothetical protein DFH29DRAFT_495018 [Suillus ampliporus]|nr:hypothetical protein DFH29DRAFT_495018 [Suillus ampliporus]